MWDLSGYTLGDLAFNGFLYGPSKEGAWAFKIVVRILYRSSFVYLAAEDLKKPIIGSTVRGVNWSFVIARFWKR